MKNFSEDADFQEWWESTDNEMEVSEYIYGAWQASRTKALRDSIEVALTQVGREEYGHAKHAALMVAEKIEELIHET